MNSGDSKYRPPGASPGGGPRERRDPRIGVEAPVRYRFESFIDFIETHSVNISRSGMFLASNQSLPSGSMLEFEFSLADGFALLRGTAEVVRISHNPAGFGIKFVRIDEQSRRLIERIVEVNTREGKRPTVAPELANPEAIEHLRGLAGATPVSHGVDFIGNELRIQINPATAGYFVYNPLLNIRLGGFVVPGPDQVSLGSLFQVTITDLRDSVIYSGEGKVVAKHERRLGIRLAGIDKSALASLQNEINRMGPSTTR